MQIQSMENKDDQLSFDKQVTPDSVGHSNGNM